MILAQGLLSISIWFSLFFAMASLVVAALLCCTIPATVRWAVKWGRLIRARAQRRERMLANDQRLRADAIELEGIYYFDQPQWPAGRD